MELATEDGIPGEARGVGGGIQRTGDDERDKGEDEDRERAGDCAWWATAVKGAKERRRRAKLLEALWKNVSGCQWSRFTRESR